MLRIGLTGGIGSGKSTVAQMFSGYDVPVIDADDIAKQLVAPDQPAYREIVNVFGSEIISADDQIDRERLRKQVFADSHQRRRLEAILHPRIRAQIERQMQKLAAPYCVIVIPLLIETGQRNLVDRIVVIDAEEDIRVRRVTESRGLTGDEVRKVIAAQTDRDTRLGYADDVISNDGNIDSLQAQIEALHNRYLSLTQADNSTSQ